MGGQPAVRRGRHPDRRRRHRARRLLLRGEFWLRRRPSTDQRYGHRVPHRGSGLRRTAMGGAMLRQRLLGRHHRDRRVHRWALPGERVADRQPAVARPRQRWLRTRSGTLRIRAGRPGRTTGPPRRPRSGNRHRPRMEPGLELLRGQQGHARHEAGTLRRR